jgi:hypothetical protein
MNYNNNNDILTNVNNEHSNLKISTILLNGYIYRADSHANPIALSVPKFFGTYESAIEYLNNGDFLKKYSTMGAIRILNLSCTTAKSKKNLRKFFKRTLIKKLAKYYKTISKVELIQMIKFTYVLLQLFFCIGNNVLDLDGIQINDLYEYADVNKISKSNIDILKYIVDMYDKVDHVRMSIRPFDKLIANNLFYLLSPLGLKGFTIIVQNDNGRMYDNTICNKLNTIYSGNTCVPTEICIFNPKESLVLMNIHKKVSNKLVKIK